MKNFISVCGYGSTGSSAVVNLIEESNEIITFGQEFRLFQEVDGLQNLVSNLKHSWSWIKSDAYIRRFIKYTNILGRKNTIFQFGSKLDVIFNNKFYVHRDNFLNELIDSEWNGYSFHHDYNERNKLEVIIEQFKRGLFYLGFSQKFVRKITKKSKTYYVRPDLDIDYLVAKFIENLLNELLSNKEYKGVIFDQAFLPYDFKNYQKFIPSIKQIVVDRDPRDVYLDAINYNAYPINNDINSFISFYESTRNYKKDQSEKSLFIQFEDLIYKYEETRDLIIDFTNLNKKEFNFLTKFNPNTSISNTQTWLQNKNKKHRKEIDIISERLNMYCYDF